MTSRSITSLTILKILLIGFLTVAALFFGKTFLVPLAMAGLLAALFHPFCKWLERHKFKRLAASLLCMFILLLTFAGVFALIGWQVAGLAEDFDKIRDRFTEMISAVKEFFYTRMGIPVEKQEKMLEDQQSGAGKILPALFGSVAGTLSGLLLTHVYLVLLLYFRRHLKKFILMLAPAEEQAEVSKVINETAEVSHQYLSGLSKMIVCLWIMYGIGFSLIGVKNALFFAVLCGGLEIIPFVGNITGTGLTVLVSAIQGGGANMILGILLVYGFIQLIQTWVLEPLVVGSEVKLNAFATIISLVLGELIWGVLGIMLAIPLAGMFKIVCDHITSLKPVGFLLGEVEKSKPSGMKEFFRKLFKRK